MEQMKIQSRGPHPAPAHAPSPPGASRLPGNPPASWLAPLASEKGTAGTGPMGVGDSAGCGCQGRGPTSSVPLQPRGSVSGSGRRCHRLGEYGGGALRTGTPRGQVRGEGGGGVGWGLPAGRGSGSGGPAGQAPCIPRRLHTLVLLLWSFPRTSSPGSRRVSDSLTCSAVALLPVSQVGSVLNWNEVPPGSRRGRSRVMVNWFQGRCFWQSLRNSGTESEG